MTCDRVLWDSPQDNYLPRLSLNNRDRLGSFRTVGTYDSRRGFCALRPRSFTLRLWICRFSGHIKQMCAQHFALEGPLHVAELRPTHQKNLVCCVHKRKTWFDWVARRTDTTSLQITRRSCYAEQLPSAFEDIKSGSCGSGWQRDNYFQWYEAWRNMHRPPWSCNLYIVLVDGWNQPAQYMDCGMVCLTYWLNGK